jgi:hypothetical protein
LYANCKVYARYMIKQEKRALIYIVLKSKSVIGGNKKYKIQAQLVNSLTIQCITLFSLGDHWCILDLYMRYDSIWLYIFFFFLFFFLFRTDPWSCCLVLAWQGIGFISHHTYSITGYILSSKVAVELLNTLSWGLLCFTQFSTKWLITQGF